MSVALNAVYLIVRVRGACHRSGGDAHTGECSPLDVFLWLSAALLVLIPVVADVTNVSGWGDPDTLYPTILSVGSISALLAWDVRSVWSRARRRAGPDVD